MKISQNKLLIVFGSLAFILLVLIVVWWNQKKVIDINGPNASQTSIPEKKGILTGTVCENPDSRLISVMLSSDPETRPLSSISQADMVFEMPVTPDGITRMMAVYQCQKPERIGSIRSARQDFIPLAAGLKSIYAHWGGEHGVLNQLNARIVDNLDALTNKGNAFFRVSNMRAPHNGFTTYDRIIRASQVLGYNMINTFEGYPHANKKPNRNLSNLVDRIDIDFDTIYDVSWTYNVETNSYTRFRAGRMEIDKNNDMPVSASIIAVMHTAASHLRDQYINVRTTGTGTLEVYQNGIVTSGTWQKGDAINSKLFFYDSEGKEIEFTPGKIWIEIVIK